MGSYMRGIEITHNSIVKPMQPNERGQLEDGGCVYTNTPCPNCSVSNNFFEGDPTVYGCIYHVSRHDTLRLRLNGLRPPFSRPFCDRFGPFFGSWCRFLES